MKKFSKPALVAVLALLAAQALAAGTSGEQVYNVNCAPCHKVGLQGAPKIGDRDAWAPRVRKGTAVLLDHALNGFGAVMPPRGGNTSLGDDQVRLALAHLLASVGVSLDDPARDGPQDGAGATPASAGTAPARVASAVPLPWLSKTLMSPVRLATITSKLPSKSMSPVTTPRGPPPTSITLGEANSRVLGLKSPVLILTASFPSLRVATASG